MNRQFVHVARGSLLVVLMVLALPHMAWADDYEPVNPPFPDPHFLDPQLKVTPSDGLVTGQTVMVTGRYFGANDTNGVLRQCTVNLSLCDTRTVNFTTGANGEFNPINAPFTPEDPQTIPIPFTVNPRFTSTTGTAVNCLVTACVLYARWADAMEVRAGAHHLAFRVPDGLRSADYNGDGKTDFAVYRPANGGWYVAFSGGGSTTASWGASGDVAVPGDYNGDGKTDFGVFRPSNGTWYIAYSGGGSTSAVWGVAGDIPVPGDYNADGKTDFAYYRPTTGEWKASLIGGGTITANWGVSGDVPVPGDYNGDGKTDFAVYRPTNGGWYVAFSGGGSMSASWGTTGDIPLSGPYLIWRQFNP